MKSSTLILLLSSIPALAVGSHPSPAVSPLDTFRLLVVPATEGPKLPVALVNVVQPGDKLRYEPVHLPAALKKSRVRIVVVPVPGTASEEIRVLEVCCTGAGRSQDV